MYLIITTLLIILSYIIASRNSKYRNILILISALISLIYIIWRVTVIPINNGVISFLLGLILVVAELSGLIAFLNFQYLFTKKYKLERKGIDSFENNNIPHVDVLICTYNESLDLLEKTIAASVNMNYPKDKFEVYICDDGRRDNLKALCKRYNIKYITRNDNEGAKAGNINNALKIIKGELFAVLDADMIPTKEFLSKTVGYFSDEDAAFVQTPQVYYNQDMYQYNLKKDIPNEQDFFMRDIEEARAAINAVLHVGTNAVFRKKYVDEIGGYPTCSITEDMAVGMLLQMKGYKTIFVNEKLALGLSATTFTELVKQRDRWCRGNLQVVKKFNIIFNKGLTFGQKIAYLDGVLYWFLSFQKMIYILSPIIYLLTNRLLIDSSISMLLNMYIPFFLGQILIFKLLSPKTRSFKWAHYYEVAMAPHMVSSILREILNIKIQFNVTSKNIVSNKKSFQFRIVLPHIIIIILSILAWGNGTVHTLNNNMPFQAYLINIGWSLYNFIGAIICIRVAYQKPIFRENERIKIRDNIKVTIKYNEMDIYGNIIDISEKGMGIKLRENYDFNLNSYVEIVFNNTSLKCRIVRRQGLFIGVIYNRTSVEQMKSIMNIYVDNMMPYYDVDRK